MKEAIIRRIDRWGLAACLLIALALRGFVVGWQAHELTHERDGYLGLAQGLVEGRGFCTPGTPTPTAFRPPLYPLQLAVFMRVAPTAVAVAVVNLLWGAVTVWATWHIGGSLGLGGGRGLASLLVAVDPLLVQYTVQPMTETMCAGLVGLLVLGMIRREERGYGRQLGVGALFGLVVLCRPAFWPLAGLLTAAWLMQRRETSSRGASDMGTAGVPWRVVVGMLLVIAPWVIRNQLVFGSPILTTTHGGYTLLLANNSVFYDEVVDQPWGTVWQKNSLEEWQAELDARLERELGPNASELDRDRRQSALARESIAAKPLGFAKSIWHRIRSLWSTVPHGEATVGVNRWLIVAVGWYYTLVLPAFAVGLIVVARRQDLSRWVVLYAIVATVQAVHLVYWTNARMRAPLTPLIALFAAAAARSCAKSASCDSPAKPEP